MVRSRRSWSYKTLCCIWYVCIDCGAHLDQGFREVAMKTAEEFRAMLEKRDLGGEKEVSARHTFTEKLIIEQKKAQTSCPFSFAINFVQDNTLVFSGFIP